jgi:Protein of unknown function (DUF402)
LKKHLYTRAVRAAGKGIVLRNVWRGRPWIAIAANVVQDEPDLIALHVPEGAPFGFAPVAPIPHPWEGRESWRGHGVLMLHRPDDAYAVWVFWEGPTREFSRWYVNFQTPLTRSRLGFDTLDHVLDLSTSDGKTWHWKDDELLDQRVAEGLFTADEAARIRADAARVRAELEANGIWWNSAWAKWSPAGWPKPRLAADWTKL